MCDKLPMFTPKNEHHIPLADRKGGPDPQPPKNSQVAIDFLRNSDKDPNKEQFDPVGSRGRSAGPSMKCVDD